MKRVLLSWSSGKDSAWALHLLRQQADIEVVGLLTTFNASNNRAAMHAIRRQLVQAQSRLLLACRYGQFPCPFPAQTDE